MREQSNVDRAKLMHTTESDMIEVMRAQGLNPAECLAAASMVLLRFVSLATGVIDDDEKAVTALNHYTRDLEFQFRGIRKTLMKNLSPDLRRMAALAFQVGLDDTRDNIKMHHRALWDDLERLREAGDGTQ